MDNKTFKITNEGKDAFALAMKLAISGHKKIVGYRVADDELVLYWTASEKCIPFPYEFNTEQATEFAWGWLEANKPKTPQPDHDGDNKPGFHVYCEAWGHVKAEWQAFVAIGSIWAMYGK